MIAIADALTKYRQQPSPPEHATGNPFKLVSTLQGPSAMEEVTNAWGDHELPKDALDLWAVCREARLFEDAEYGQWGLVLLSPSASAERTTRERTTRRSEFGAGDLVLGEFLGDQELLVLAPSEDGRRRVLVVLPLDSRSDWYGVASDLGEFLERYFDHVGEKYWERTGPGTQNSAQPSQD